MTILPQVLVIAFSDSVWSLERSAWLAVLQSRKLVEILSECQTTEQAELTGQRYFGLKCRLNRICSVLFVGSGATVRVGEIENCGNSNCPDFLNLLSPASQVTGRRLAGLVTFDNPVSAPSAGSRMNPQPAVRRR